MKKRVISGIIIALICIPTFIIGGMLFDLAIGLLAILAYKEFLSVRKDSKIPMKIKLLGLVSMILLVYSNIDTHSILFGLSYKTLSLVFLMLFAPTIFIDRKKYNLNDAFYLACISIFLGTVFNLFITVFSDSKAIFLFLLLISCITDIFALFGGMLVGNHKLSPISPNKTIEGSISGVIFATIICTTFYAAFITPASIFKTIILVIILSIIGQIGDLFFSLIKRENDIKDFSNLIPGHGGILDRIDNFIFVLLAFVFISSFL